MREHHPRPKRKSARATRVALAVAGIGSLVLLVLELVAVGMLDVPKVLGWSAVVNHALGCTASYIAAVPKHAAEAHKGFVTVFLTAGVSFFTLGTMLALAMLYVAFA